MGKVSELVCTGAKGEPVQSWLIHPAGFVPEAPAPAAAAAGAGADGQQRQYPLAVIVHGGPQGAILDSFGYRWNPQTYAGAGFAVLCVNFHGTYNSTVAYLSICASVLCLLSCACQNVMVAPAGPHTLASEISPPTRRWSLALASSLATLVHI